MLKASATKSFLLDFWYGQNFQFFKICNIVNYVSKILSKIIYSGIKASKVKLYLYVELSIFYMSKKLCIRYLKPRNMF